MSGFGEMSAVIGLAGNIAQFLVYGARILKRLEEYNAGAGSLPESFQDTASTLRLLLTTLSTTEQRAKDGNVTAEKQSALSDVVSRCRSQIQSLELLLQRYTPSPGDSRWRIRVKAFKSVRKEPELEKINKKILEHIQILTYHEATSNGSSLSPLSPSTSLKDLPLLTIPFKRDFHFVGRQTILTAISTTLEKDHQVGLFGVGGVGKTQIAIESIYRFREAYPDTQVFWIHASNPMRLRQSYQEVFNRLQLTGWDDPDTDVVEIVNERLERQDSGRWLFVLDNLDDLDHHIVGQDLSSHGSSPQNRAKIIRLPQHPLGHIILTSRDARIIQDMLGNACTISVPHMSRTEAETLLTQGLGDGVKPSASEVESLLEILGHIPLAITQAAALINVNSITTAEYLDMLNGDDADVQNLLEANLGDPRRDKESDASIFKTWRLSFELIRSRNPDAADLLALMAMLERGSIPRSLLFKEGSRKSDIMMSLGMLKAFSLVHVGSDRETFNIHRLVQLATQNWLRIRGKLEIWQSAALATVSNAFSYDDFRDFAVCDHLSPHAATVLQYAPAGSAWKQNAALLMIKKGNYDGAQGRYAMAAHELEGAVAVRKDVFGVTHEEFFVAVRWLLQSYNFAYQYEKTKQLAKEYEPIASKNLGQDHHITISMRCELAWAYLKGGQLPESEAVLEECTRILEQTPSIGSDLRISCLSMLSSVYAKQRKFKESEAVRLKVIELNHQRYSPNDPRIVSLMVNLASICVDQNRLDEAEQLLTNSIQSQRTILGDKHPTTLNSLLWLGRVFLEKEQYEDAEELFLILLEKQHETLGDDHPAVMTPMRELARTYTSQQRDDLAEPLHKRLLDLDKHTEGDSQRDQTIKSTISLSKIYERQQRYNEALKLGRQALELAQKRLGDDSPTTTKAMTELAATYKLRDRWQEAEELEALALRVRRHSLGEKHPDTLESMTDTAYVYQKLGYPDEAHQLNSEAIKNGIEDVEKPKELYADVSRIKNFSSPKTEAKKS